MRRIIELALPHLVRKSPIRRVTLAVGEAGDEHWVEALRNSLGNIPLEIVCVPAFGYLTETKSTGPVLRRRIARALQELAPDSQGTILWVHNPGLARNIFLTDELRKLAGRGRARVVFHHHDFWFENRWGRWDGLRKAGFRTVRAVGDSVFGAGAPILHATINRADAALFPDGNAAWLPNLADRQKRCSPEERDAARRWMREKLGRDCPVWLFPTRFLRRKNLGEAVLITRWLRPEGWLLTTAGVSSPEESAYARRLEGAARRKKWPVRFRALENEDGRAPSITALLAAAEAVVMTSAQEGFGLPYLEAVGAGRPLIARRLPNVVPDLESFGFRLPWLYDEIWIDPALLNEKKERESQMVAWKDWRDRIPGALRKNAEPPPVLQQPPGGPLPFSRLTLDGQLQVLAHPAGEAWEHCARWNPDLVRWKTCVAAGRWEVCSWPRGADEWIGGPAYAERFWQAVQSDSHPFTSAECQSIQENFIRERLGTEYLYPILFPVK